MIGTVSKYLYFCVALSITKLSRLRAVLLEILPFLNVKVIWFLLREKRSIYTLKTKGGVEIIVTTSVTFIHRI